MMTVTTAFFYQELCASLGNAQASEWLVSEAVAQPSNVRTTSRPNSWHSTSSQCRKGENVSELVDESVVRPATCPVATFSQWSDDLDISELASKLGVSAGLIYTDAAHTLLDSIAKSHQSHLARRGSRLGAGTNRRGSRVGAGASRRGSRAKRCSQGDLCIFSRCT